MQATYDQVIDFAKLNYPDVIFPLDVFYHKMKSTNNKILLSYLHEIVSISMHRKKNPNDLLQTNNVYVPIIHLIPSDEDTKTKFILQSFKPNIMTNFDDVDKCWQCYIKIFDSK
jgi:hypothetical protein